MVLGINNNKLQRLSRGRSNICPHTQALLFLTIYNCRCCRRLCTLDHRHCHSLYRSCERPCPRPSYLAARSGACYCRPLFIAVHRGKRRVSSRLSFSFSLYPRRRCERAPFVSAYFTRAKSFARRYRLFSIITLGPCGPPAHGFLLSYSHGRSLLSPLLLRGCFSMFIACA